MFAASELPHLSHENAYEINFEVGWNFRMSFAEFEI
jgi:hypothetical protein